MPLSSEPVCSCFTIALNVPPFANVSLLNSVAVALVSRSRLSIVSIDMPKPLLSTMHSLAGTVSPQICSFSLLMV